MKYRPELDGLRALAIVPVVFFHAGFSAFSGGFVGVDVFFVISGYLITTIILNELTQDTFRIVDFYERRARRILPALIFVLLACTPFAWFWLLPEDLKMFSQSLVAVSMFVSNVFFWKTSNYFETAAELNTLQHTWSLAVEEQYYILFPLFLMVTWKLNKRWLLGILGLVGMISLALSHWGAFAKPAATFYLLPTRAWELLIGSFVAFWLFDADRQHFNPHYAELGGLLGLLLLLYSVFFFSGETPFPSLYTLIPTVGTALLILFATRGTLLGQILSSKVFVGVGLLSYSTYLWHQPLFAFVRYQSINKPSAIVISALIIMCYLLAYLSWRYIELPFRDKRGFDRKQIFAMGFTGTLLVSGFGVAGYFSNGFEGRMPGVEKIAEYTLPKIDNGWCFYSIDSIGSLKLGDNGLDCWLGDRGSKRRAILFGDSYAGQYEPLWDAVGQAADLSVHSVSTNWCHPTQSEEFMGPESSRAFQQCLFNRDHLAKNVGHYDVVILAGHWQAVLGQHGMEGTLDLVGWLADRVKLVVLMSSPRQFDTNVMALYRKSILRGIDFDISWVSSERDSGAVEANEMLESAARRYDNILYVNRESMFNVNGVLSDTMEDGVPFSMDGYHISIQGAKTAAESFLKSETFRELFSRIQ